MTIDTPLTDAEAWMPADCDECVVSAYFARQLERELAAANARIRDLRDEVTILRLYGYKHRTAMADDALAAMRRTGDPVRDLCGGSDCDLDGEKLVAMRKGEQNAE